MNIRIATARDSAALLAIYAQYIDTSITFEYVLPTVQEFAGRIMETLTEYPYLVCEDEGTIVGYCYAHRAQVRAAYQWNAEASIYLDREYTGRRLGKLLYGMLFELLAMQGVKTVYGCVTDPNPKSVALHERVGFTRFAVFPQAGYKCGAWHDVLWFQKELNPHEDAPVPVTPFPALPQERVAAILRGDSAKA